MTLFPKQALSRCGHDCCDCSSKDLIPFTPRTLPFPASLLLEPLTECMRGDSPEGQGLDTLRKLPLLSWGDLQLNGKLVILGKFKPWGCCASPPPSQKDFPAQESLMASLAGGCTHSNAAS